MSRVLSLDSSFGRKKDIRVSQIFAPSFIEISFYLQFQWQQKRKRLETVFKPCNGRGPAGEERVLSTIFAYCAQGTRGGACL